MAIPLIPMNNNHLPRRLPTQIELLQAEIGHLQMELDEIIRQTSIFENLLRAQLGDELIEEQELTLLYKQQKKAKKAKRPAQKKHGRNAVQLGAPIQKQPKPILGKHSGDEQQKKQLYREAMLSVHPDKFSMQTDKLDLATKMTTQLIEIYRSGDLVALKAYHAHIFGSNTSIRPIEQPAPLKGADLRPLRTELKKLQKELAGAKNKQTYKVLIEYKNPMCFLNELKAYYQDRLMKLRKRTKSK